MKKRLLLILPPIFVGLVLVALALVLPAQASQAPGPSLPDHPVDQVYGLVQSFPNQLVGEWVVNGVAYTADNHTIFRPTHGPFSAGVCVGIMYMKAYPGNGLRAWMIESAYPYKCNHAQGPLSKASGILASFPESLVGTWVINTTTYTATATTRFEQEAGPFAVGSCVEVIYDPRTFVASEIETGHSWDCGALAEEHFFGLIEQVPAAYAQITAGMPPITGTWVISGVQIISTPQTRLERRHGPLVVGACAKVEYRVINGLNIARKIESEWGFLCAGPVAFNQIYGALASFPPDLYGTWVLSTTGNTPFNFMTDPSTQFFDKRQGFAVGMCVRVKYYTNDGVNHAVQVSLTRDKFCRLIEAPVLSKLLATVEMMPSGTYTGTWMLAGVTFTATEKTRFEADYRPLAVGDCVEAIYNATDGAMLLSKVEKEEPAHCRAENGTARFKVYGVVETLPVSGTLTGTWQISGISMDANSSTQFEQEHGLLALGAFVSAKFTYDAGSGVRTALKIETHVAPGYGCLHRFGRLQSYKPAGSQDGYSIWIVDGIKYLGDPGMEAGMNLKIGSLVTVNAYQSGTNLVATQVVAANSVYLPTIRR
jgi:hypothetical protein